MKPAVSATTSLVARDSASLGFLEPWTANVLGKAASRKAQAHVSTVALQAYQNLLMAFLQTPDKNVV